MCFVVIITMLIIVLALVPTILDLSSTLYHIIHKVATKVKCSVL